MNKEVENWLSSAKYDLRAAADMLKAGHCLHTVFLCHLAVEKGLKAKVREVVGKTPPKRHDLIALLRLSGLRPPDQLLDFLGKLSGASVATRYPEDLSETSKLYPRDVAEEYLRRTEEVIQWITRHLRS